MRLAPQPVGQAALPRPRHRSSTSCGRSIPVALAVLFAFNDGRSRTTWQGFSTRWFTGESGSVLHDPALQGALRHTLFLGVVCVLVATPLGVALALGLQRWRGPGGGTVNTVMLLPLVTPEIVMGVALLLLFLQVLPGDRARLDGPGDRAGDVHDLVRRRDRARPARLDRQGLRGGGRRPRGAAARPAHPRPAPARSRRRSSRARLSCSPSRSTTSSSRSTSRATRARRPCRCCSTRRPARRRRPR